MRARYVALAALLTHHLVHAPALSACAPAPREGETVAVADEEALIAYDPVAGVEHFIRRAAFRTAAREFGFLVPTPAVPALTEAPAWLFDRINAHIAPRVETRTRYVGVTVSSCCLAPFLLTARGARSGIASAPAPVEVLSTQRVAGYDATVLRARDADALSRWLADHGYANGPDLRAWLAPYVAEGWIVTAFRVARPDPSDPRPPATSSVRMTFATPRAVYPYREPASQRADATSPRRLRVHVLAPQRVEGTLGTDGPRFPGAVTWSRPQQNWGALLGDALPAGATQGRLWLTSFDDTSAPRPGTDDVWFRPDGAQAEVIPAAVVRWHDESVPVPVDLLAVLGVGGWWWARRRRRAGRRERSTPAP
ncbi:MAG: DUF2330 domain-containing protein [Polyangiales bacterium]